MEEANHQSSPQFCDDIIAPQKYPSSDYQNQAGRLRYSNDPLFKLKSKSIADAPQVTYQSSNVTQIDQLQASLVNQIFMVGRQAINKEQRKYQGRRGFATTDKNPKKLDEDKYMANFKKNENKTRAKNSMYSQSQEKYNLTENERFQNQRVPPQTASYQHGRIQIKQINQAALSTPKSVNGPLVVSTFSFPQTIKQNMGKIAMSLQSAITQQQIVGTNFRPMTQAQVQRDPETSNLDLVIKRFENNSKKKDVTKAAKQANDKQELLEQQQKVWQALQILKLFQVDSRFQQVPSKGLLQQQITHQYGFQLTEAEMHQRVFKYVPAMKGKPMYAQLECVECLKLTRKMLEDEQRLIIVNKQRAADFMRVQEEYKDVKRPKSNNVMKCRNSRFIEITVEQAIEMLQQDPAVFMAQKQSDSVFAPMVKGQQIINQNPTEYRIVVDPKATITTIQQPIPTETTKALVSQHQATFKKKEKKAEIEHWQFEGMTKRQTKDYAATSIKQTKLTMLTHLNKHSINLTIEKVNEVIMILFKQKIKSEDNNLIGLFRYFNIPIPRGHGILLDQAELKKPDFLFQVNIRLMQKLNKVVNQENNNAKPETGSNYFKFYVGVGNNYPTVRQIIKRRSWWHREKQERFIGQDCQADDDQEDEDHLRGAHFVWTQWRKQELTDYLKQPQTTKLIYNRIDANYHLANKKALFMNIDAYYKAMGQDPFEVAIPLTFHIKTGTDKQFSKFERAFQQNQKDKKNLNIWIIKPGENSNRGTGIQVANNLQEIKQIINTFSQSNGDRTSIVQKYLEKPLLISGRKFDLRTYAMITSVNGVMKGYMYRDCYFRTSSKAFDLSNLQSRFIHLTNDAVQQNSEDYGKFESANKLSINDFQRYLDLNFPKKSICFMRDLFPAIERLVTDSFRAVHNKIDPKRLQNSFEIFGYDFMIDEQFKVYMIEANTNPCLEICCPLLARIIPELLDNSFRIAVDPLYQPPSLLDDKATEMALQPTQGKKRRKFEQLQHIKYRLVYDELIDGPELNQLFKSTQSHNQQLMAEIMEEELICAQVAQENEQKVHESIDELPRQAVILPIQSDSDQ